MNVSVDLSANGMVGMPRDAFTTLHAALFRDAAGNAPAWLQEAGYAGGPALFEAFGRWCAARGLAAPESLGIAEFGGSAAEFLSELGWGGVRVEPMHESALALDSADWAEANPAGGMQYPGCYFSAGLLADFFGRIAGAQLVAMEVECRSVGHERCRFLLASAETIQHVYDGMVNGVAYEESLAQMA
jgi:predicted hydrocarbon binding protein